MPSSLATGRFTGTVERLAPFQTWSKTPLPNVHAFPFGRVTTTNEIFDCLQPWLLKKKGYIEGTTLRALGNRGKGKTASSMKVSSALGTLSTPEHDFYRISVDDTRRNNNVPEWKAFVELHGSTQIDMSQLQINYLDPVLSGSPSELLNSSVLVVEFVGNRRLGTEILPLQLALTKMLSRYSAISSPELLLAFLNSLTKTDVIEHYASRDNTLLKTLSDDPTVDPNLVDKLYHDLGYDSQYKMTNATLAHHTNAYPIDDFYKDVAYCRTQLERPMGGDFGYSLGGRDSISSLLEQRVVSADYSKVVAKIRALTQTIVRNWRTMATQRPDGHRWRVEIDVQEENYAWWPNLAYAQATSYELKTSRAHGRFTWINSHRLEDSYAVGSDGSEQQLLAVNSLNETDMFLIGRYPRKSLPLLRDYFKFSRAMGTYITNQRKGDFVFVMPDSELGPIPMHFDLTPLQRDVMSATDAANDRLVGSAE